MARFSGLVGFVSSQRTVPGVSSVTVVESPYYGDVKRAQLNMTDDQTVNTEIRTSSSIEIVADKYASENMFAIRFVVWAGVAWEVVNVTPQHPRLLLQLGGVYDGKRADPTP